MKAEEKLVTMARAKNPKSLEWITTPEESMKLNYLEQVSSQKEMTVEIMGTKCPVKGTLIDFGSDAQLRKLFFAPVDVSHPAKANLQMMDWLIRKYTKAGETIVDPTSGAGSLMYATLLGRNVVNIELEHHFVEMQQTSWAFLRNQMATEELTPEVIPIGSYTLLEGDAKRHLASSIAPNSIDHCIFSPPYATSLGQAGAKVSAMAIEAGTTAMQYGKNVAQISNMSYFNIVNTMKEIYRGVYNVLKPGGIMVTITKDCVDTKNASFRGYNGILPYSADTIKICYDVGFEMKEYWLRYAPPSLRLQIAWSQADAKERPIPHITTEDIIVMEKKK